MEIFINNRQLLTKNTNVKYAVQQSFCLYPVGDDQLVSQLVDSKPDISF
jgi:hypothetical protein